MDIDGLYGNPSFIERISARLFVWALNRRLSKDIQRAGLKDLIANEVAQITSTMIAFNDYQVSEVQVLTARLGRRYDPGMALNEATARALEDKETAKKAAEVGLTGKQLAALEFQKKYMKGIVGG